MSLMFSFQTSSFRHKVGLERLQSLKQILSDVISQFHLLPFVVKSPFWEKIETPSCPKVYARSLPLHETYANLGIQAGCSFP
ncbi:MAG: hypothetical protein WCI18_11515, partial [Pseudomonadota bacterium]